MSKTLQPTPQLPLFDLVGRRMLVLGLGESGLAMARWGVHRGAQVRVLDSRAEPPGRAALLEALPTVPLIQTPIEEVPLDETDLLAWSPGISIETGAGKALREAARERGIPVMGEIELFAQALAQLREQDYQPKVIAITGTNGKTTTTALVGELCRQDGARVEVAGNISPAALDRLREAIERDELPDIWVLELSSFQLALTDSLRPDVATILNISEDHLDWHASMATYTAAKQRIYAPGSIAVSNRQDPATVPTQSKALASQISFGLDAPPALRDLGLIQDGGIDWLAEAVPAEEPTGRRSRQPLAVTARRLMPAEALRIRGRHNQANALAALALARGIGLPMKHLLHALREFEGEPHRCELIFDIEGVHYVDDSKGTNVGATVAALEGLGRPIVLIAGGDGKGQDFAPLAAPIARHAHAVVLIGRDGPRLAEALADTGVTIEAAADLPAAVRQAAARARPGDTVLLSPACASLDMFRNYAHRAEVFAEAVRSLALEAGIVC